MTHPSPLPWSGIDTVLLDMDGTLLDLRFDTVFWQEYLPERYAAHHEVDPQTARERIGDLMRGARPRLDYYCFEWWSRATGLDITALKPDLAHLIAWRDGAEAFIGGVRASGRRAIIVTNAHPSGIALKHSITGIADHVDALEHAHDHDHPKEHAGFWERVHARLDFDPARTLLVDDNLEVLASAERYGIAHLRAVAHPDSGRPPLEDLPYPAVHAFAELLAELLASAEEDPHERS